jgi:SP family galactose:H+ symporter-like MFS transporter
MRPEDSGIQRALRKWIPFGTTNSQRQATRTLFIFDVKEISMKQELAKKAQAQGYKTIVYVICMVAALGGLLFGLDQGFIANSLETLTQHYQFDVKGGENYSAILATGGIVGALLSGIFARFLGRKRSLVLAGFVFTAASALSALLPPLPLLSACRFALGFGVGVASFIVPLYLSETAPAAIRGSMGTLFQLMITIGIFLIAVSNVFIAHIFTSPATSLPLMFLTVTLFASVMFVGSFILPESPRWLMLKGRKDKAIAVLGRTLNSQEEIDAEIGEIEEALHGPQGAGVRIVFRGYFFKVLLVGILLQVFQQLVGINMMIYYSPAIFGYAGMKGLVAMMTVPTVNMLFTFPAIHLVEKWGRKKLLYVGAVAMLITMIAAGLAFQTIGGVSDASLIGGTPKMVLLLSVIVYIFGFAVSWGLAGLLRNIPARGARGRHDHHDDRQLDLRGPGDGERSLLHAGLRERFDFLCLRGFLHPSDPVRSAVRP